MKYLRQWREKQWRWRESRYCPVCYPDRPKPVTCFFPKCPFRNNEPPPTFQIGPILNPEPCENNEKEHIK